MSALPEDAETMLLALADEQQRVIPGVPIPLDRIGQAAELTPEECRNLVTSFAQRGLVLEVKDGPRVTGAMLTALGLEEANALGVLPPEGPVSEFAKTLDEIRRAVLDSVSEWQLRIAGGVTSRSHVRTSVRNRITPKPDIAVTNLAIDALVGTHLQVLGGSTEPQYQVTLRGLLASRWGKNALNLLDQTLTFLREWKNREPSLLRYSWRHLRKERGLPARSLSLAYLAITNANLGRGLFESEGDKWWATPPDLDLLIEHANALDYVRSLLRLESTTIAWTQLSPHRPLPQGDPHYAKRPQNGGAELAEAVRAGWKRIAVVGPMGVGKSTELAAAQNALYADRFAFRIRMDTSFDMRHIRTGEVFKHVLERFLAAKPNANVGQTLRMADELVEDGQRDFRRDLARKALRAAGRATLLIDGLEKADEGAARAVAEEFFSLGEDAEIVLVVPTSLTYGPGAALLGDDVHLFSIRPVVVWGEPAEAAADGRLFLREIALRHLERRTVGTQASDVELLEIVDAACIVSGGVPRVLLQILRDVHRQAIVARRSMPSLEDLERAKADHGEYLRRSLVAGDISVLKEAEGTDGSEVPHERKLRLLLQGLLLEYRRGARTIMHMAPTLAQALGVKQGVS